MTKTPPPNEPTIWEFIGYSPSLDISEHRTGSKTLKLPRRPDVIVSLYQYEGRAYAEVEHFFPEVIWFSWTWNTPVVGIESKEFGHLLSELREVANYEL